MAENRDNVGERGTGTPVGGKKDLMSSDGNAVIEQPELVRTCAPAVAACVLAVVSLLLMPAHLWALGKDTPESVQSLYVLIQFGTWFLAGVLGIASLIVIGTSGGRFTGKGFAWAGVGIPASQLFAILFLAFARGAHGSSYTMACGANLSTIGKAMLIYTNDFDDRLLFAGGPDSQWTGRVADWAAPNREKAFGLLPDGSAGQASISANLYLLVKYAEVPPKVFLCGATTRKTREKGVTEFTPYTYRVRKKPAELTDFWDFGPNPPKHCSYAYHMVYGAFPLTVFLPPGFAIAADRNPWIDSPSAKARDFAGFRPDIPPFNGTAQQAHTSNTFRHAGSGQNVLFLDTHVEFEKRPYCGLGDDNIYTSWDGQDKSRGVPPKLGSTPADKLDSLLVNDPVLPTR